MKKTSLPSSYLVAIIWVLLAVALPLSSRASMTISSLTGSVTATEISSFKSFMSGQSPPSAQTYDNTCADGTAGMECEALGMMYEVTNDPALLNEMIVFADDFLSLRNDFTDQRVMWTGNVDPVWLTKAASSSEAGYAGCENNDIVGHIAYCAKLILETPSLWNTTVPDGNPHGYGATYYERATNYVGQLEYSEANYFNKYFVSTSNFQIVAPTSSAWTTFGESVNAWNRQMMFMSGWQRLSECHQLLGDSPSTVTYYNEIVQASVNWFFNASASGLTSYTTNSHAVYNWDYAPLSGGSEDLSLHADYDMWGLNRIYLDGTYTNLTESMMLPFANTLQYVIYKGSDTFADWVSGDSVDGSRNYIYPAWTLVGNFGPENYFITSDANISQGSQGSTAIFDAFILWVKNARYLGTFANNTNSADYTVVGPWAATVTAGSQATCKITVAPVDGFNSTVTLGTTGLPSGVTASFSPSSISGGSGTSTMTLTASGSTTPGIYSLGSIAVTGSGGSISRTSPLTLVVDSEPNFSISGSPSSQNITIGGSTSYTTTIGSLDGFSGNVALSVSGLPAHAGGSFSPSTVTGGSGSSTLNITTATNTPSGTYTLTITGVSGTLTNSTTVTLELNDFTVSLSQSTATVTAGNSTNYTVNVGNVNGFGGTVNLSASGLPTGTTAGFNPTSIDSLGSSTLTISTSSSMSAGTNTFTVVGADGSLQHGAAATLIVNASSNTNTTWITNNDTSGSITYASTWSYSTNRNYGDYNNDVHYTKTNGASASFTFNGTGVEYITETFTNEGNVQVYIDNVLQATVNCNTSTRQAQVVMYATTGLSSGSHTIKIVMQSGAYMLLDAFAYTTSSTPNFSLTASPSQTVTAGAPATYSVTNTALNGFGGNVALSVSGLPSGATASFSPGSISGSGTSTLTVTTTNTMAGSSNTLTITGISGTLTNTTRVTLVVNAAVWTLVNDTDSGISYSSGWSYSSGRGDGDYDDDVHYTRTAGDTASYTFTGTSAEYLTETYSDEGNVQIYIDGNLQTTVNCNSSTRQAQVVMYSTTSLPYGSHTIEISMSSGTYMLLDAFGYK